MSAELEIIEPSIDADLYEYQLEGSDVTVHNKRVFLTAYRKKASVYHAAQVAGINRKTVYDWLQRDAGFNEALDDCKEDTADIMETSVFEKALAGDSLLKMFWLKAYRHKFRDKTTVDINVVDNEIRDRLAGMDLKQLSPMTTTYVDYGSAKTLAQITTESSPKQKD